VATAVAGQVTGHHVGVALDDDRLPPVRDLSFGQVSSVEDGAFAEERSFRGIKVFRSVVVRVQFARAEGNHVAGQVADRPHQPAPEPVHRPASALTGQSPGDDLLVGEALGAQVPGQLLPGVRGVTNAEPQRVGPFEAPLGQERPAGRGRGTLQLRGVELGRDPVRVQQPPAPALFLARDVATLFVAQVDAGPPGQPFHRLDEGQAVDLLHEADDVAALAAGEAVIEAARGGDVEGGGLLVVERAQALQRVAARAAELQVFADHLVDRRTLADRRDVLVADPASHLPPPLLVVLRSPVAELNRHQGHQRP
jgi:hypothetical protein